MSGKRPSPWQNNLKSMGETMTLIFLFGAFEKHPKIAKKYDPGIFVFGTTRPSSFPKGVAEARASDGQ